MDLLPNPAGMIGPESPPFPAGASAFADPGQSPLSGHYHRLPQGTLLPAGMAVVADGSDVLMQSVHGATHHTFFPSVAVAPALFIQSWLHLPWQYAGKKP